MTISPGQLAEELGLPPPTPEQAAVIAAPAQPTLVVAGAGAGKTETMAARVVWMVANRLVAPDAVLGLTFTRKAAAGLAARIRGRLARLAGSRVVREVDPSGQLRAELLAAQPVISTYHAYAGRLLSEYGLLLPVEPSVRLLGTTGLWQVAYQVVRAFDGDLDTERTPAAVTEAVLALSGQLAEHLVDPDGLVEHHTEFAKLVNTLPPGPRQRGGPNKTLLHAVQVSESRLALLPLVEQLAQELRRRGALDFGSQMSLAARLATEHPQVAATERERFTVVLLDEYQDTGHSQRVLLAGLFAATADRPAMAVTAVGDPMQSIYGWRGASAANLPRFTQDFPCRPGVCAPVLALSTSWRNPPEVLVAANALVSDLRRRGERHGAPVRELQARPEAPAGTVRLALTETVVEERHWIAEQIADQWRQAREAGCPPPTSAVLVRRNADAPGMAEALRAAGLPVHIVGLGGLLATPEVADVVATLRMVAGPVASGPDSVASHTAASGGAALRIVTGARWRIGAADVAALAARARELSVAPAPATDITDHETLTAALHHATGEPSERAGLIDAIADPGEPQRYSPDGYARIVALGRELADLRQRSGWPLSEFVAEVERTIGVAVETETRAALAGSRAGRAQLDAFADVVAEFAAGPDASLPGLLAFLAAAESVEDGLTPGEVEVVADRVQISTIHAAKGLEWEVVAVPHVVRDVFPSSRGGSTWLGSVTELPTALRGDRAQAGSDGVPVVDTSEVTDRAQLQTCLEEHRKALQRRRIDEDRRLFYVAVTRSERVLLVSAHHWGETGSPRGPSEFLRELHGIAPEVGAHSDFWAPEPADQDENPLTADPVTASWPRDPLGDNRSTLEAAARVVSAAIDEVRANAQPDRVGNRKADSHQRVFESDEPESDKPRSESDAFAPDIPEFFDNESDQPDSEYLETDQPEFEWHRTLDIEDPDPDDTDPDPEGWRADVDALLAEHHAERTRTSHDVPLPPSLPATALVELQTDPHRLAARLHRPMPTPPNPLARRGTAFHAWVVRWFTAGKAPGLPLFDAPDEQSEDPELARLQRAFLASTWAHRTPIEVEVPFDTTLRGTLVRGRMDAVFAEPDGCWTIVDWKTGNEPSEADESAVAVQLAMYRLAWARLQAIHFGKSESELLERITAVFHYVRSGRTIAPRALPGPTELAALLELR